MIDKTQLPAVVTSTDTLIYYTIVITNNGPSAASNVIVTETLPAELQPYTTTNYSPPTNPTAGTYNFNTNNWSIGSMAKGARETLVLITRPVSAAKGSTITNQARVRSTTHDWNLSNNQDSTTFVVGGLDIQKGVSKASTLVGEMFSFAITVTNLSNSSINASVRDVLSNTLDVVTCDLYRYTGTIQSFHSQCFFSDRTLNSYITIPKSQYALFIVGVRGNKDIGETPENN